MLTGIFFSGLSRVWAGQQQTDIHSKGGNTFTGFGAKSAGSTVGSASGSTPAASGTSLFGNKNNASQPATEGSLFGGATNMSSTNPSSGGLFGGGAQSSGGFGNNAANNTSTSAMGTIGASTFGFGSNTNNSSSAPSAAPSGGLFGGSGAFGSNTSNAAGSSTPASKPAFGGFSQSTTPAAAPPASSGTSLFGGVSAVNNSAESNTGSGLFGAKPATSTAAPTTGGLFGTKPTDPSTAASTTQPSGGGLFGGSGGGGLFGSKPAEAPKADSSASATPSGGLFAGIGGVKPAEASKPTTGGFSFGAKTATPAPSESAKVSGFSFGGLSGGEKKNDKTAEAPKPASGFSFGSFGTKVNDEKEKTSSLAVSTGGLFGSMSSETAKPATSTPAIGSSLAGAGSTSTPVAETAAAATKDKSTEPTPNLLKGKTLEDIVEGWNKDLEEQVEEFERQAGEIREWDKILVRNGNQITALRQQVFEAQQTQAAVDEPLNYFEAQQQQLESTLDVYEKEYSKMSNDKTRPLAAKVPADLEREKAYSLAEDLNRQLDDISRNLSQMIEQVNKLSTPSASIDLSSSTLSAGGPETSSFSAADVASQMPDDPINQLSAILGAHLRALNSIDANAEKLGGKLVDLESKLHSTSNGGGKGWRLPRR
nr:hypothetical protein L203_00134 [Cryptococcus depauperatus CBS 7841]